MFLVSVIVKCFCNLHISQLPEKLEPALADKEIIMAALNIKSMNFGSNFLTCGQEDEQVVDIGHSITEIQLLYRVLVFSKIELPILEWNVV